MIKLALKASFEKESEIWVKVHFNLHNGLKNRKQTKKKLFFPCLYLFFCLLLAATFSNITVLFFVVVFCFKKEFLSREQ